MAKVHPRLYPRLSVPVSAHYTIGDLSSRCVANTLSGGGLFLSAVEGLKPGDQLSIRFRPAKHLPVIRAKVSVKYKVAGRGTAVEFIEITSDDRHRLLRLIHKKTGDRRISRRRPLATQVQSDQCLSLAFSRDLSLGGMFIETRNPLPVGSPITVRFNLNQKDRVVTTGALVVYQIEKMGMGVLFSELPAHHREAIEEYFESSPDLLTTSPGKSRFVA